MRSTREDVEAVLGPPPPSENRHYDSNKSWATYLVDGLEIFIAYADQESLARMNCQPTVAAGTVTVIRVTPKNDIRVSDLFLDEKSFRKFNASDPPEPEHEGLIDEKEGLVISAFKGIVAEMVYIACASDRQRCPGFSHSLEDLVLIRRVACDRPFDEYGDIRFADEKARLDNFGIQVLNEENSVGYIIAYAGRKAVVAEAQLRANRARDYLINVRKINPDRLKAIDGGHREELTVVLRIHPSGAPPPPVDPTVPPSEVEIVYPKKPRPREKAIDLTSRI